MRWLGLIGLAVTGLVGCGGGAAPDGAPPSGMVGAWRGTWNDALLKQSGTMSVLVSPDDTGTTTGTITNNVGLVGTIAGHVRAGGDAYGSYDYPSTPSDIIFSYKGSVAVSDGGHLVGFVQVYDAKGIQTEKDVAIDLVKQ